jgi:ribosomal protein S18 acetylase RimI-like enzyme
VVEPDSWQILPAGWRDLNDLRQIEKICFGEDAWPLWDLVAVLTFAGIIRMKAVVDGRMVGFIAGEVNTSEGVGWITTIGVLPEYRRQGIAKALLVNCEEHLGTARARLSVRRSNQAAIHLYQQAGYVQSSVWPAYYVDREDALILEKKLSVQNRNVPFYAK